MANSNKEYWQKMAGFYTPFMKNNNKIYEAICKQVEPELNRKMTVLELACGTGQLSFPLAPKTAHWEATDFSEQMIKEARKRAKSNRLYFSVQDATNLPYADKSFDAVMIANALHIMPEPEKALGEIRRVLKDNGLLFAPTFVQQSDRKMSLRMRFLKLTGFKTYHKWNDEELLSFICENGFSIQKHSLIAEGFQPLCNVIAQKK
ncbi:MAG: class I SAM-dependent methyltransferase [Treponema sp.]